jgi:hypothetical protein
MIHNKRGNIYSRTSRALRGRYVLSMIGVFNDT